MKAKKKEKNVTKSTNFLSLQMNRFAFNGKIVRKKRQQSTMSYSATKIIKKKKTQFVTLMYLLCIYRVDVMCKKKHNLNEAKILKM